MRLLWFKKSRTIFKKNTIIIKNICFAVINKQQESENM